MFVHEAEIFPNVVAPATARQDGESLHSDLGTHVLPNRIKKQSRWEGNAHIPDTSMTWSIDCSSSRRA